MTISLKQQAILGCVHRIPSRCYTCRTDGGWRDRAIGEKEFDCPHGFTADKLPSRGLGDTIAKLTSKVGIKPCGGCKARQAKLNTLVPYKVDNRPA